VTALGFQLYSLHAVSDPLPDVLARVGGTPFEGVEFAGLDGTDPAAVAAALDDAGLAAAGAHVPLDEIAADPGSVARTYRAVGCTDVVVPWLDPAHFRSRERTREAGRRLAAAADGLADHGVSLHYHTHDGEFARVDGRLALDCLLDAADGVGLQLDLGWAGAAGHDPVSVLRDRADRVETVHLKDYDADAGAVAAVGAGDLDVDAAVAAVREAGVRWLVYEAEDRPDAYATLDHAAAVVRRYA
jgi:sugar phosphate isomerase/epimerase